MFNLKINFNRVSRNNWPRLLQTSMWLNYLKAVAKPFKIIYGEFTAKKNELVYKTTFNGSVLYLETALNDKYDPIARGITITDAFYNRIFIYRRSESKPAIVLYRRWNNTTNFVTGKFCYKDGIVWESNATPNINKVPGVDPEWDATTRQVPIVRRRANFNSEIHFWVNVPGYVSFDELAMRELIKYWKLAGLGYVIRIM